MRQTKADILFILAKLFIFILHFVFCNHHRSELTDCTMLEKLKLNATMQHFLTRWRRWWNRSRRWRLEVRWTSGWSSWRFRWDSAWSSRFELFSFCVRHFQVSLHFRFQNKFRLKQKKYRQELILNKYDELFFSFNRSRWPWLATIQVISPQQLKDFQIR